MSESTSSSSPPSAARDRARRLLIVAAALLFVAATVHRFHWLGGPWFELPETIQDHVWPARFPSADAILLCRRVEPMLARNAEVTVVAPAQAPNYDQTHWLTALGLLPRQHVVAPDLDGSTPGELTDFVITIGDPLPQPAYHLVKQFPEGALYEVNR